MSDLAMSPTATGTTPSPEDGPNERRTSAWWRQELLPLLRRIHFYAGLTIAPFLLLLALTGLMYTMTPQLDELIYHDELHVSAPAKPTPLPLGQQIAAATRSIGLPASAVESVRPPVDAEGTTRVSFHARGLDEGYSRTVFINPYNARIRGTLTTFGEWLPLRAWFDSLHRTLHLGSVGRVYSELGASWLWVITLSGLGMWLSRRRRDRRVRHTVLPQRGLRGRARLASRHGAVGLWLSIGLLFLSATGITWSQFAGENVTSVRQVFSWSTPDVNTTLPARHGATAKARETPAFPAGAPGGQDFAEQAQRVLTVARAHGLSDPVELDPPARTGEAWTVSQVKRSWPEKQDSMAIDAENGRVVDRIDFAEWSVPAKLARWGIDAHMGLLFGLANQIALAVLAIGLIGTIVLAYRMWWKRRPAPVGKHRAPKMSTIAVVGALATGIGVFLPVFGISLLVFLAFDGIRSQRMRSLDA